MSGQPVVLFLGHFMNPAILAEHQRLEEELGTEYRVRLAYDNTRGDFARLPPGASRAAWCFTHRDLFDTAYPRKGRSRRFHPGNVDLVLLRFFREHPEANAYWLIEHDVRFSGRWTTLFDTVRSSGADLIGTTLATHDAVPAWRFWYTLDSPPGESLPAEHMVRGFFPIIRLTHRALELLDASYRRGWTGHWEGSVPTILRAHGLSLEDLGGDGPFVPPGRVNRFYTNTPTDPLLAPGSFVFRPIRDRPGPAPDTLWHPVKRRRDRTWKFRHWRDRLDRWRTSREHRRAR